TGLVFVAVEQNPFAFLVRVGKPFGEGDDTGLVVGGQVDDFLVTDGEGAAVLVEIGGIDDGDGGVGRLGSLSQLVAQLDAGYVGDAAELSHQFSVPMLGDKMPSQ